MSLTINYPVDINICVAKTDRQVIDFIMNWLHENYLKFTGYDDLDGTLVIDLICDSGMNLLYDAVNKECGTDEENIYLSKDLKFIEC